MANFTLVITDDEGNLISAEPINRSSTTGKKRSGAGLVVRSMKAAASLLWDGQTRTKMDDAELDRYATAKRLIRKKRFESARKIMATPEPKHPESLNLLGVVHEALGDNDNARRCYGRAFSTDRDCWAARMNGRRIYELDVFGSSTIPMYL